MVMKMVDPYALGLDVTGINGDNALCRCPFHNDNHPSGSFSLSKGIFHCFACGENANLKSLAEITGGEIVYTNDYLTTKNKVAETEDWIRFLSYPLAIDNPYLEKRQVTNEQVEQFKIRQFADGIIFPLSKCNGQTIGVQIRFYTKKPKYMFFGERPQLWPLESLKGIKGTVFLTEGIFGALRARNAKLDAFASMSCTSISKVVQILNGRPVVVVFDNDFAGYVGAGKLILSGYDAACPTFEADSASKGFWKTFSEEMPVTRSVSQLAKYSGSSVAFLKLIEKYKLRMDYESKSQKKHRS
jgi:DNA primase